MDQIQQVKGIKALDQTRNEIGRQQSIWLFESLFTGPDRFAGVMTGVPVV